MQRGFAHLLLIVIFAAILLGACSYFFVFKGKTPEPAPEVMVINDKMVPPVPPTEEQMQQDRLYKNEALGFEFTTPKDFIVTEETEEEFHKRSNGEMRKNFTSTLFYSPAEFVTSLYVTEPDRKLEEAVLSVWVFENPENLDASAFYNKYWYYPFVWGEFSSGKDEIAPTEKIVIGEASASSAIVEYRPNSPRFIYLPKEGKMYLFKEKGSAEILKSFVFTP